MRKNIEEIYKLNEFPELPYSSRYSVTAKRTSPNTRYMSEAIKPYKRIGFSLKE
jgi:hypothetical protein